GICGYSHPPHPFGEQEITSSSIIHSFDFSSILNEEGEEEGLTEGILYRAEPALIDTSEGDLSDDKMLDHTYSGMEDDTFQASMIALHGSSCSADLDCLQSSTPKLTARLNVLEEHPGFGDDTPAFSAQKSASYTPATLTGHIPAINAILSSSDQYLATHPGEEQEPVERSDSCSLLAEIAAKPGDQEGPVEPPLHLSEPAISFRDTEDLKDEEKAGVKEPTEEDDNKAALTSRRNFERTITVVKGNCSLGAYLFLHIFLFLMRYFFPHIPRRG
ncbi:hypothetical protein XENORESO_016914, partial [Xenotaenia resolanae]